MNLTIRTIITIAATALTGCVYTTEGTKLSSITPPLSEFRPVVEHSVGDFSFTLDGGKMVTSNTVGKALTQQLAKSWKDKKYVSEEKFVGDKKFSGKADYNVLLSGTQYGESSIGMQILSGLTLFLIPYSVTQHYDIQYTLNEPKTGKSYSASVQEANKTYVELFLLFALPFSQSGQHTMIERMGDHLYDQLHRQGAFQKSKPAATVP